MKQSPKQLAHQEFSPRFCSVSTVKGSQEWWMCSFCQEVSPDTNYIEVPSVICIIAHGLAPDTTMSKIFRPLPGL